jgi:hypothetical protein
MSKSTSEVRFRISEWFALALLYRLPFFPREVALARCLNGTWSPQDLVQFDDPRIESWIGETESSRTNKTRERVRGEPPTRLGSVLHRRTATALGSNADRSA